MNKFSAHRTLLSNPQLLTVYLSGVFPDMGKINLHTFHELHNQNNNLPDYAVYNSMAMAFNDTGNGDTLLHSFDNITEHFLTDLNRKIYVKKDVFHEWQDLLTDIPPLALVSYKLYKNGYNREELDINKLIPLVDSVIGKTAYPSIHCTQLNQLIETDGLHERHMHLNGSIEADTVWLDALQHPRQFFNTINKGYKKRVKDQYLKMGIDFTPRLIHNLLKLCSEIRIALVECIEEDKDISLNAVQSSLRSCNGIYEPLLSERRKENPLIQFYPKLRAVNERVIESLFLIHTFHFMKKKQSKFISHLLHIYLLTSSQINRLLVQQRDQSGFDQFQKITKNECRRMSEKRYLRRFSQFEGMYGEDISTLEGRFAPRENYKAYLQLLHPILKDFQKYKNNKTDYDEDHRTNEKRMDLSLVVHLIKEADYRKFKNSYAVTLGRHRELRLINRRLMHNLVSVGQRDRLIKKYLKGIDAASNELHTPPEVYAPIYRYLQYNGYEHFTYHVGEDYIHLLSGIRAVYEAITFLKLNNGNRIGHATALGIKPEIWKSRSLVPAVTTKGEWFDNLVFAWEILSKAEPKYQTILPVIKENIHSLTVDLYGNPYPIEILIKASKLRDLDTIIAFDDNYSSIIPFYNDELQKIKKARWRNEEEQIENTSWKLFKYYHSDSVIKKYEELYEVTEDPFSNMILKYLQECVINLLNKKGIAIETLVTSNVRISYYKEYKEHHLPQWLGVGASEDVPMPSVVVGTDDSGIFATNLRNEYAHIFLILTEEYKLTDEQAYHEIKRLNTNSEIFSFR